jgi:hypothetical protein
MCFRSAITLEAVVNVRIDRKYEIRKYDESTVIIDSDPIIITILRVLENAIICSLLILISSTLTSTTSSRSFVESLLPS